MNTILIENDVFSEDEKITRNSSTIASKFFNVVEVDSILDIEKHADKNICFYRGSFAVGAVLRRYFNFNEQAWFYNCTRWVPELKRFYINKKYNILDFESCLNLDFPKFIRPCSGNKSFSGQLFANKDQFNTEYIFTTVNRNVSKFDLCLYAQPKLISEEYRCVFVNRQLVSACGYLKEGERVDFPCSKDVIDLANTISTDSYFTIPNFVIDICRNQKDDSLHLLEINSIYNASFYSCDLFSIYEALANFFNYETRYG
jgi:hypothetical protein